MNLCETLGSKTLVLRLSECCHVKTIIHEVFLFLLVREFISENDAFKVTENLNLCSIAVLKYAGSLDTYSSYVRMLRGLINSSQNREMLCIKV